MYFSYPRCCMQTAILDSWLREQRKMPTPTGMRVGHIETRSTPTKRSFQMQYKSNPQSVQRGGSGDE